MKQGMELLRWASEQAKAAAVKDSELIGASWNATTVAIAEAYLLGGVDALADEVVRAKSQGAVSQADGSAL